MLNSVFYKYSRFEIILFLMTFGAVVLYATNTIFSSTSQNQIGVMSGRLCAPPVNIDSNSSLILKSLHITPIFLSRCLSGRLGLDSDQDGLCDQDEDALGYDKNNSFSKSKFISDRVHYNLQNQGLPMSFKNNDCQAVDSDADLLYDCEELLIRPTRYQGADLEQTYRLWSQQGLKPFHPDSDEDGFIDGIEFRLVNSDAPFIHQNSDTDPNADLLLKNWIDAPDKNGVNLAVKSIDDNCYSYSLLGIDQWFSDLVDFDQLKNLALKKSGLSLDFIVYALFSSEDNPTVSTYYGAKIITITFDGSSMIDNKVNQFNILRIEGGGR